MKKFMYVFLMTSFFGIASAPVKREEFNLSDRAKLQILSVKFGQCSLCGKMFASSKEKHFHLSISHPAKCIKCGERFLSLALLNGHNC